MGVEAAEPPEGEVTDRRAVEEEGSEAGNAEAAGGEGYPVEERRAAEGEVAEAFVGDVEAALELEPAEGGGEGGRDEGEGGVVDADELTGALEREGGDGGEAGEEVG